jgi:hypothetical protein
MNIQDVEIKVDSQEKLLAVAGLPTVNFLFAPEFNTVVNAVKGAKVYQLGEFQVFKRSLPLLPKDGSLPQYNYELELGDFVKGIVENIYIEALYIGGDFTQLTSFDIYNQIAFSD